MLERAQAQLDGFHGSVDAVIGFWDLPVTTMVPILCARRGLRSASLDAVVRCEHKYWSRLEQQKVIDEHPRFGLIDLEHDTAPPEGVGYPMWVKPVKSFSSDMAFGVANLEEFRDALAQIREASGVSASLSRSSSSTSTCLPRSPQAAAWRAWPRRPSAAGS